MEDCDPFSLLVGDDSPIGKRLKNPRAKGEKDRYTVPEEDWDPFENLLGRQEYSGEFPQDESEESFPLEVDSNEELLEADREEEELSFYSEDQASIGRYEYYREDQAMSQTYSQTSMGRTGVALRVTTSEMTTDERLRGKYKAVQKEDCTQIITR